MYAADLMTSDPISATPDATVGQALSLLHDNDIRHLPIVADGNLVGILSDRDLHGFIVASLGLDAYPRVTEPAWMTPVSVLMSGSPLTVNTETEHGEIIDLLVEHKIGAVPVVDPVTDNLIGIVSYQDILRAFRDAS